MSVTEQREKMIREVASLVASFEGWKEINSREHSAMNSHLKKLNGRTSVIEADQIELKIEQGVQERLSVIKHRRTKIIVGIGGIAVVLVQVWAIFVA